VTLVDTNVILDLAMGDERWAPWSLLQLKKASLAGPLVINDVIYAELSVRFDAIDQLDFILAGLGVRLEPIPRRALFSAARAFRLYRSRGGTRTGVLPDFFIGAHAVVQDYPLLTQDAGRYGTYFPGLGLIAPDGCQGPSH
jgi:predicted nucleic acid-binding protein